MGQSAGAAAWRRTSQAHRPFAPLPYFAGAAAVVTAAPRNGGAVSLS